MLCNVEVKRFRVVRCNVGSLEYNVVWCEEGIVFLSCEVDDNLDLFICNICILRVSNGFNGVGIYFSFRIMK